MEYRTAVSEFQIAKCLSVAAGNESGTCCQKNVTMQNIIHIKEKKFGMVSKKRREMITLMLILLIKKKWFDIILQIVIIITGMIIRWAYLMFIYLPKL